MDFGKFREAVNRTADMIAPAYKAGVMAALPAVVPAAATLIGVPWLAPIALPVLEAGVAAASPREVLAVGLAPSTGGMSLFLFTTK